MQRTVAPALGMSLAAALVRPPPSQCGIVGGSDETTVVAVADEDEDDECRCP